MISTALRPSLIALGLASIAFGCSGDSDSRSSGVASVSSPTVTSLEPSEGSPVGGTAITIRGSGLASVRAVILGNGLLQNVVVASDTELRGETPPSAIIGPTDVTVVVAGGSVTLPGAFRYAAVPVVTRVLPAFFRTTGDVDVTIEGANFEPTSTVAIAGVPLRSPIVLTSSLIVGKYPAVAVPGQKDVVVTNSRGTTTLLRAVEAFPPLSLGSISPSTSPSGGGVLVTVKGTSFVGALRVLLGGLDVPATAIDAETLTFTTPPVPSAGGQGQAIDVVVTSASLGTATLRGAFRYDPTLPAIAVASVQPFVIRRAGGTRIRVVASNLDPDTTAALRFRDPSSGTDVLRSLTNVVVSGPTLEGDTPAFPFPSVTPGHESERCELLLRNARVGQTTNARALRYTEWLEVGPARAYANVVAVNPNDGNLVYVGGPDGLHKSTDGGVTFTPLHPSFPVAAARSVWDIELAPDPNVLYVKVDRGGSAAGAGRILRSGDGGASWQDLGPETSTVAEIRVGHHELAVAPLNTNVVYTRGRVPFGSTQALPQRSTDGTTFQNFPFFQQTQYLDPCDLRVDPTDVNRILFSSVGRLFRTSYMDGSFSLLSNGKDSTYKTIAFEFDPANPNVIYDVGRSDGAAPKAYVTADGGMSWTPGVGLVTPEGATYARDVVVDPVTTPRRLLAVNANELQLPARNSATLGFGNVFRSQDGGLTWALLGNNFAGKNARVRSLAASRRGAPQEPIIYAAAQSFDRPGTPLWASTDGGSTFQPLAASGWNLGPLRRVLPGRDGPNGPVSSSYAQVLGSRGRLLLDLNTGTPYTNSTRPTIERSGGLFAVSRTASESADADTLLGRDTRAVARTIAGELVGTFGQGIFVGPTPVNSGLTNLNVADLSAVDNGLVAFCATSGGGVFRSDDGGSSWMAANVGLPPAADVTRLVQPDVLNPTLIYASVNGGGVFRSIDGAMSWAPMNIGLADLNVVALSIAATMSRTLYAGTAAAGVFRSLDDGATWSPANTGLPTLVIRDLATAPPNAAPGAPSLLDLVAAATDQGVFLSFDRGASWTPYMAGAAPLGDVTSVGVVGNGSAATDALTLLAGAADGRVFELVLNR